MTKLPLLATWFRPQENFWRWFELPLDPGEKPGESRSKGGSQVKSLNKSESPPTCKANLWVRNLSAMRNFMPPPTINIELYIFFFMSSVGHDSMLFKIAWSRLIKSELLSMLFLFMLGESSFMISSSSSITCELSGSFCESPGLGSPA